MIRFWIALTVAIVLASIGIALRRGSIEPVERPIVQASPVDAGFGPTSAGAAFTGVAFARSRVLRFELRGADFEDARGRGCPLEAVVDEPDAGDEPVLRFRCAAYGGP